MTWRWDWGDLHSHCSINYGHGAVDPVQPVPARWSREGCLGSPLCRS